MSMPAPCGRSVDRGDDRLVEFLEGERNAVDVFGQPRLALIGRDGAAEHLEVGAGAEMSSRAREDKRTNVVVGACLD